MKVTEKYIRVQLNHAKSEKSVKKISEKGRIKAGRDFHVVQRQIAKGLRLSERVDP